MNQPMIPQFTRSIQYRLILLREVVAVVDAVA